MQVALHSDEQGQHDVVKRGAPHLHTRFTGDTNQHRHLLPEARLIPVWRPSCSFELSSTLTTTIQVSTNT